MRCDNRRGCGTARKEKLTTICLALVLLAAVVLSVASFGNKVWDSGRKSSSVGNDDGNNNLRSSHDHLPSSGRRHSNGSGSNARAAHHGATRAITAPGDGGPTDESAASGSRSHRNELLVALYHLPLPTTHRELEELNDELADLDPQFILMWARRLGGTKVAQVTSFGPTGLVILDLLWRMNALAGGDDVDVITMDTLHLFPESYDFYDTVRSHYKDALENLVVTKPLRIEYPPGMHGDGVLNGTYETREEFDDAVGSTLWRDDPDRYAKLTKVDPLEKALVERGVRMWITGRRRSTGGERSDLRVLEFEPRRRDDGARSSSSPPPDRDGTRATFDVRNGRWKLNPLAYFTSEEVWEYMRRHGVPYNPLYDKRYTSLGDVMTTGLPRPSGEGATATDAAAVDALERSGRFAGMGNRTECGLHVHVGRVKRQRQEALEAGEDITTPTLPCGLCVDLNVDDFGTTISSGDNELLVEFYSPYCGGCQAFAPTLDLIATDLSVERPNMKVVRFDVTEDEVPRIDDEEVFEVESTPTLYWVRHAPSFHVERYDGEHDYDAIRRWLHLLEGAAAKREDGMMKVTKTRHEAFAEAADRREERRRYKKKYHLVKKGAKGRRKRVSGEHFGVGR